MNTTVERELETRGRAMIRTAGVSMEPLLHAKRSSVVLVKPDRPLAKNDVVLFHRGDEWVLHRIIRTLPDGRYIVKGDNCYGHDIVEPGAIVGLMEGYYRDERDEYTACGSAWDRRYVRTVWLRRAKIQIVTIIYRFLQKIGLR